MLALDGTQIIVASLGVASTIVVAVISLVGVLLSRKVSTVQNDNRADHAEVFQTITRLVEGQESIAADVRDVKADVSDLKADVRDLKANDRELESRLDDHIADIANPKENTA